MNFQADITIMPLPEILDPQGKAVTLGLQNLGIDGVVEVRMGKQVQMRLSAATAEEAEEKVILACQKLLCNPIMETYTFVVRAIEEVQI
ncbi:MAG: phosphoribosylformylglycinamidine synthase subunit PurS [Bernardetiaceae bacterium]